MNNYFVYFLQSLQTNRFYIGVCSDLGKRIQEHNQGLTKSTKPYRPWKIIYTEEYRNKKEAYKREFYLKQPRGYLEKRKIIEDYRIR